MARRNIYEVGKELRNYLNDELLKKSFLSDGNIKDNELVDITNNYGWTAKLLNGSLKNKQELGRNQFTHQIPFAMAFERKQTINSTIRNIAQTLTIGTDLIGVIKDESDSSGFTKLAQDAGQDLVRGISKAIEDGTKQEEKQTTTRPSYQTTSMQEVNGELRLVTKETPNTLTENTETPDKSSSTPNIDNTISYARTAIKTLMSFVKQAYNTVGRPDDHLTSFLYPYSFMYMTEPTGFQFVFPMLTDGAGYFSVTNQWSNGDSADRNNIVKGGTSDLINNFVANWIEQAVGIGASLYVDVQNLRDALSFSDKTIQDYFIEKAKFYNYATDGQKVNVRFTLYNTVQQDIWKKHYKFLYLFALRNLPFKFTPSSFSPPLLYDIFLPGSKYLPLCYVSNFNVTNQGVTRRLSTNSILKSGGTVQVSVPDAWVVDLEFTCMLGPSANLMLAAIEHETSINVISTTEDLLADVRSATFTNGINNSSEYNSSEIFRTPTNAASGSTTLLA